MSGAARLRSVRLEQEWLLDQAETTIGRSDEAHVTVPVAAVSRLHAHIRRTPYGYTIEDRDSRNGTFVNGQRLTDQPLPLRDGDEVVVAGIEVLQFNDPMATPMAPAIGRFSGVWVNTETGAVWVDAQPMDPPLSARQHALLMLLYENEGAIVTRETIVEVVWADVAADGVSAEAIDALVKRVKARLRALQVSGDYLETLRGRGLRLRSPSAAAPDAAD